MTTSSNLDLTVIIILFVAASAVSAASSLKLSHVLLIVVDKLKFVCFEDA